MTMYDFIVNVGICVILGLPIAIVIVTIHEIVKYFFKGDK